MSQQLETLNPLSSSHSRFKRVSNGTGYGNLALKPCTPAPANATERPALGLVKTENTAKSPRTLRTVLLIFVVGLLLTIIFPLLINSKLAVLSYETHDAQVQIQKIREENESLRTQIDELSSPGNIRTKAEESGMLLNGPHAFISLHDGTITTGHDNKHS